MSWAREKCDYFRVCIEVDQRELGGTLIYVTVRVRYVPVTYFHIPYVNQRDNFGELGDSAVRKKHQSCSGAGRLHCRGLYVAKCAPSNFEEAR